MIDVVNLLPVSRKSHSRVGKKLVTAVVEQRHHDGRMFCTFRNGYSCWIPADGGDDFRVLPED